MDPQSLELAKTAGRASLLYAGIAAGTYFVFELLSKIWFIGFIFFCLNVFIALGAYFGISYLVSGKLTGFPPGQSVGTLALYVGLGVAAVVTVAFLVAVLISGILGVIIEAGFGGSDSAFSSAISGMVGLFFRLLFSAVGGIFIGGILSFLGSYVVLNRNQSAQSVSRPF